MVDDKWQFLVELDERLLEGGVILSEWATFLTRDADMAFVNGAPLSSLITGLAAVETHLRAEHGDGTHRLNQLINDFDLEGDLKEELHVLRRYRNRWVHVSDPGDDQPLLQTPDEHEKELEEMARRCIVALRRTLYWNPWV